MISRWLKPIQLPPVDIFSLFVTNASVFNERAPKLINGLRGLAATERRRSDIVMQRVTWNHLLSTGRAAGTKYLNHNFGFRVEPGWGRGVGEILTVITEIKRLAKSENSLKLRGRRSDCRSGVTKEINPEPKTAVKHRSFPHKGISRFEVQKGLFWSAATAKQLISLISNPTRAALEVQRCGCVSHLSSVCCPSITM